MQIKIINKSTHELPNYETLASAGMDLRANITESITLNPLERTIVKTGLFIELPIGYEAQVRPRSGLAAKKGITVLNSPGTVDEGYTGEVKVIIFNTTDKPVSINKGMKIAQCVIASCISGKYVNLNKVESIKPKDRNENGFGSTGI